MAILTDRQFVAVAALGFIGAWMLKHKIGRGIRAITPTNPDNIINRAVEDAVGEEKMVFIGDLIFGGFEVLNPYDEDDGGEILGKNAWAELWNK